MSNICLYLHVSSLSAFVYVTCLTMSLACPCHLFEPARDLSVHTCLSIVHFSIVRPCPLFIVCPLSIVCPCPSSGHVTHLPAPAHPHSPRPHPCALATCFAPTSRSPHQRRGARLAPEYSSERLACVGWVCCTLCVWVCVGVILLMWCARSGLLLICQVGGGAVREGRRT